MKGLKWGQAALAMTVLLTGCKGFWDAPTNSGGGGTGSSSGFFYVMNQGRQQVAGFGFKTGSSTPSAVTGGTAALSAAPLAIAMAPGGGFLFVSTGGGIFAFSVSTAGALTLLNNSQAISTDLPTAMVVDGTGTWLIESISGGGVVSAIPIVTTTGLVDTNRSVQTATLPSVILTQIATSPANSANPYVFVAMGASGTEVIPFSAAATGNPFGAGTNIAPKSTVGGDNAVAVDPSNRLLYIGETAAVTGTQTGGLRVFTIGASNSMTEVTGSPYATAGTGPSAILPTTNFVYVANKAVSGSTTGNVTGYPVSSTGGAYSLGTLINTLTAGTSTVGLAVDSSGTYLLAVNSGGSPDLNVYTFDTTTLGKLVAGPTVATGTDPVQAAAVVAVP